MSFDYIWYQNQLFIFMKINSFIVIFAAVSHETFLYGLYKNIPNELDLGVL